MNWTASNLGLRSLFCVALLVTLFVVDTRTVAAGKATTAALQATVCRGDYDGDGQSDLAVAVPFGEGVDLFMFLAKADTLSGERIFTSHEKMIMTCNEPGRIQETTAGNHAGEAVQAKHPYVTLLQPEVSSFAFFWDGATFTELQTAD